MHSTRELPTEEEPFKDFISPEGWKHACEVAERWGIGPRSGTSTQAPRSVPPATDNKETATEGGLPEMPEEMDGGAQMDVPPEPLPPLVRSPIPGRVQPWEQLKQASEAGDLERFLELTDNSGRSFHGGLFNHMSDDLWQQFRQCLLNSVRKNPGDISALMIGRMIALQFELLERARQFMNDELRECDRSHSGSPTWYEEVMNKWGPRLSRMLAAMEALLKLQSQVRHVHGIVDKDVNRRRTARRRKIPSAPAPVDGSN